VKGGLAIVADDSQLPNGPTYPAILNVDGDTSITGNMNVAGTLSCQGNIRVGDELTDYIQAPNFNLVLPTFCPAQLFSQNINNYGNTAVAIDFAVVGGAAFAALLFQKTNIQLTASYLIGNTDTENNVISNFYFKGCSQADLDAGQPWGTNTFRNLGQNIFVPPSVGDAFVSGTQIAILTQNTHYRTTDRYIICFYQIFTGGRTFAFVNNGNNILSILGMF
jgi:hypothetical protein